MVTVPKIKGTVDVNLTEILFKKSGMFDLQRYPLTLFLRDCCICKNVNFTEKPKLKLSYFQRDKKGYLIHPCSGKGLKGLLR